MIILQLDYYVCHFLASWKFLRIRLSLCIVIYLSRHMFCYVLLVYLSA